MLSYFTEILIAVAQVVSTNINGFMMVGYVENNFKREQASLTDILYSSNGE